MGTTRLEGDKLNSTLLKAVAPYGLSAGLAIGSLRGVVRVNGREELFEIEALEITAVPAAEQSPARTSPPAGLGKIRLVASNGEKV